MSEHLEKIPLFPLQVVLFPYATIQLHIFEEQHIQMINRCIELDKPFGAILSKETKDQKQLPGSSYSVGTTARIVGVHSYPDGHLDIRVQGEERFQLQKIDSSKPYLIGLIETIEDKESDNPLRLEALTQRAIEIFRTLIENMFENTEFSVKVFFPDDPNALSYIISHFLPIGNDIKQNLLEKPDASERLANLIPYLQEQVETLQKPHLYRLSVAQLQDWIYPN